MGVVHGDELQYIFADIWGEDLSMSSADIKFTKNVFTFLLTNFAKTGLVSDGFFTNEGDSFSG